jgi:hypothetical protein
MQSNYSAIASPHIHFRFIRQLATRPEPFNEKQQAACVSLELIVIGAQSDSAVGVTSDRRRPILFICLIPQLSYLSLSEQRRKKRTLTCVSARKADYYYSDTHSRLKVLWSSSASLTVQRPAVRDQSTLNHRRSAHLIAANEHRPTTALIHTWFLFLSLSLYICTQHARRTTQTPIGNHQPLVQFVNGKARVE